MLKLTTKTESIYLDNIDSLEDYKQNSRCNWLNLYSQGMGNFFYFNVFAGTYDEFIDFLQEEKSDFIKTGVVRFNEDHIQLNNQEIINILKTERKG